MNRSKMRIRALAAAALLAVVGSAILMAGSPAGASNYNLEFDTYCNANHAITAWSPDLTHEPGWQVAWAPTLYRYNGARWVAYSKGPVQTEGSSGADWSSFTSGAQSVTWHNVPQGYYQVHDTLIWSYNGKTTGAYNFDYVGTHKLEGVSYYYGASVPTWQYSTSSYCYES